MKGEEEWRGRRSGGEEKSGGGGERVAGQSFWLEGTLCAEC